MTRQSLFGLRIASMLVHRIFHILLGVTSYSHGAELTSEIYQLAGGVQPQPLVMGDYAWKTQPKLAHKMLEERAIVVYAPIDEINGRYRMQMTGGGCVNRSLDSVYRLAIQYQNLSRVSDVFKEVQYWPDASILYVHAAVMKWHARMWFKLRPLPFADNDSERVVLFEGIHGQFKGMRGEWRWQAQPRRKTLAIIRAEYNSSELPLPTVLMKIGLEFFMERSAKDVRTYLETAALQ